MKILLTKEQINKKYKGKYVEFYKNTHENTTLGEDVGTEFEYRR